MYCNYNLPIKSCPVHLLSFLLHSVYRMERENRALGQFIAGLFILDDSSQYPVHSHFLFLPIPGNNNEQGSAFLSSLSTSQTISTLRLSQIRTSPVFGHLLYSGMPKSEGPKSRECRYPNEYWFGFQMFGFRSFRLFGSFGFWMLVLS